MSKELGVVRKVRMSRSSKVLLKFIGVYKTDGAFCYVFEVVGNQFVEG